MQAATVPPTANVRAQDIEFPGLRLATEAPATARIPVALVISLGFGGANCCALLGLPMPSVAAPNAAPASRPNRGVVITGVGALVPGAVGSAALAARISNLLTAPIDQDAGAIPDEALAGLLNVRRARRMSEYVKITLAAAGMAMQDAGLALGQAWPGRTAALLGTANGSTGFCYDFYRQIIQEGLGAANPAIFTEGVPNAGCAHLSMLFGVKGPCHTIVGSRTAGLDALRLAFFYIRSGIWDRVIVGAADEFAPVFNAALDHYGLHAARGGVPLDSAGGCVTGAGSVVMVLESAELAHARGGKVLGVVEAAGSTTWSAPAGRAAVRGIAGLMARLGRPTHVLCSANATWIDRLELLGIRGSHRRTDAQTVVSSIYGHIADCSSAMPLAALSALLLTGRMPALLGGGPACKHSIRPARGDQRPDTVALLASDYHGQTTGVRVRLP
jgi:3-oxoacyl-(acyl-carrier-protein) synthase